MDLLAAKWFWLVVVEGKSLARKCARTDGDAMSLTCQTTNEDRGFEANIDACASWRLNHVHHCICDRSVGLQRSTSCQTLDVGQTVVVQTRVTAQHSLVTITIDAL